MKKFLALAMAMIMSLSLAACGGSSGSSGASAPASNSGNKVVKIGVFEPQTGDNGAGGKQEILQRDRAQLETVARYLLDHETMDRAAFLAVFGEAEPSGDAADAPEIGRAHV